MTYPELLEAYLEELARQGRSDSTVRMTRHWLEGYFQHCTQQGARIPAALSAEHLKGYYQALLGGVRAPQSRRYSQHRRYSPNSLYQMLQMVRAWLRWAFTQGYLPADLGAEVSLPRQNSAIHLTPGELERLYASAQDLRDRSLLAVFIEGELNQEQVHRLVLEDLDLAGSQLRLNGRLKLLRPRLVRALSDYLEKGRLHAQKGETAVFLSRRGVRWSADSIGSRVRTLGREAGLSQVISPRLLVLSAQAHRRSLSTGR